MKAFWHWLKSIFAPKQLSHLHLHEEEKIKNQVKYRQPPAA